MKFAPIWLLVTGFFLVAMGGTQATPHIFDWWEIITIWGASCIAFGALGVLNLMWGDWWRL